MRVAKAHFRSGLVVPGMTEEVGTFLRCKVIEEFAYTIPEGIDGALGGFRKRQIKAIAALSPRSSRNRALDRWVPRVADLIEAGLNEGTAGFARRGLWKFYFYARAEVVAWRGGERRLVV